MPPQKFAMLDYHIGNIGSLSNAFNNVGIDITLTLDEAEIRQAPALILPGVGQFTEAMRNLQNSGLVDLLKELAESGKPMLGICLGMQLLMSSSEECDLYKGLNIIPGSAKRFPDATTEIPYKIPHIGWNKILGPDTGRSSTGWENTLLEGLDESTQAYFLHSFMVEADDPNHVISKTNYGGHSFCSTIRRESVWGCQYHPEQSGWVGLTILKNFVSHVTSQANS
jgi:imidazole glycerol-phosphate synthase subunit HisH